MCVAGAAGVRERRDLCPVRRRCHRESRSAIVGIDRGIRGPVGERHGDCVAVCEGHTHPKQDRVSLKCHGEFHDLGAVRVGRSTVDHRRDSSCNVDDSRLVDGDQIRESPFGHGREEEGGAESETNREIAIREHRSEVGRRDAEIELSEKGISDQKGMTVANQIAAAARTAPAVHAESKRAIRGLTRVREGGSFGWRCDLGVLCDDAGLDHHVEFAQRAEIGLRRLE